MMKILGIPALKKKMKEVNLNRNKQISHPLIYHKNLQRVKSATNS